MYSPLFILFFLSLFPVEVDKNIVVERATEIITRYEGYSSTAYLDTSGKFSIGFGTRSYAGEVISKEEAWGRMRAIVRQSVNKIILDFPEASENELVALTSLYYNCHGGYKRVKREGFEAWLDKGFCTLPGYSGLVARRNEERNLLGLPQF